MLERLKIKDSRISKALKTSSISITAQGVNVLTSFISVPLIINAVGIERFGLWATLSAALSFLSFSDFGIGIGMQNKISSFIGNNEHKNAEKSFISAFFMSVVFAFILSLISVLPNNTNIFNLLKYSDLTISEELPAVTKSVIAVIALGIIAGIIQRTFDAHQQGYYHRYIGILSRILSLALLYILSIYKPSLHLLVLAFNGVPHICLIIVGIVLINKKYKFSLNPRKFNLILLKSIFKIGILGLGASLSIFFVTQAAPILFSITFGLNEVAVYSVIMRLLNLIILFYNFMILPLWPAITEACVKNDIHWIKKTLSKTRKYIFSSLFAISISFLLLSRPLIIWWTGSSIFPSIELIVVCCIYTTLLVWNTQISVFLNGASLFKGQSTYGLAIALVSILIAYLFRNNLTQELIIIIISIGLLLRNICMELEFKIVLLNSFQKN